MHENPTSSGSKLQRGRPRKTGRHTTEPPPPPGVRRLQGARSAHSEPFCHGPVMASVMPGVWMFTNIQLPFFGSKVEPHHSEVW